MGTVGSEQTQVRSSRQPLMPFGWRAIEWSLIGLFLIVFVGPMILVVTTAVRSSAEVVRDPLGLPTDLHWENFVTAWTVGRFGTYLGNTVIYSVTTVIGIVIVGSLAGYALARIRFPGSQAIFVVLLLGLMIPFQSIMIPLFYLMLDLGLLGTYPAMILSGIALGLPFAVFLMRAFFATLPEDVAEAARIDGAGELAVFWRVMLPLAKPGVATLVVFQFLGTWNALLLPLIVVPAEELRPVAAGLIFFAGRFSTDQALIAAAILLMNVPVLVLYLLLQKQFIRGVTAGATRI